jgi:hypothetical protein
MDCFSFTAFAKATLPFLTVKTQIIYGQGLNDHLVMGGFGVTETDALTNRKQYAPLNYFSAWATANTMGKRWQVSVFGGYTRGFGANEDITGDLYARDANIKYVWRVAPMLTYFAGKFSISSELELTTASYGTTDSKFEVNTDGIDPVSNLRLSLSAVYAF